MIAQVHMERRYPLQTMREKFINLSWLKRSVAICFVVSAPLFFYQGSARAADDMEALYKSKCASCHAPDGSGNTSVGKSLKPPTKGVTPEQVKQLVAHIRMLKK